MQCFSVLTKISIGDFIDYIKDIHENKGNIAEQRDVVQTKSAKMIRNQMIADIQKGEVIPPIVLGVVAQVQNIDDEFLKKIYTEKQQDISIVDGMQRTEALKKALNASPEIASNFVRVEFWIAQKPQYLLYRMLILNSGQTPWEVGKQLAVIFKDIVSYLKGNFNLELEEKEESFYIELLLLFNIRKISIDKKQQLAENFALLDMIEILRKDQNIVDRFGQILLYLQKIDAMIALKKLPKVEGLEYSNSFFSINALS